MVHKKVGYAINIILDSVIYKKLLLLKIQKSIELWLQNW